MSTAETPHSLKSSAWRFLLAGGANTVVTAILLSLLSLVIDPKIAYTIVFAAGVAFSTYMANRYVYGVRMTRGAMATYVAMYVVVYLIGLVVISQLERTGLSGAASGFVVLVTAPLTFIGGRLITSAVHRSHAPASATTSIEEQ